MSLCSNYQQTMSAGSAQLRPFVYALVKFFIQVFQKDNVTGGDIPELDNSDVRRELALLFYDQNKFKINEKADALEALDKILLVIHAWMVSLSLKDGQQKMLDDCLDVECYPQKCIGHSLFFL